MKNWLVSSSGILTVAIIAFLSFAGYAFLATLVLGKQDLVTGMAAIGTVVVVVLTGSWLWALLSIGREGRGALMAIMILGLLNILAGASDIFLFCPTPCQGYWPLAEIWHWIMVFSGLAVVTATGMKLKQ